MYIQQRRLYTGEGEDCGGAMVWCGAMVCGGGAMAALSVKGRFGRLDGRALCACAVLQGLMGNVGAGHSSGRPAGGVGEVGEVGSLFTVKRIHTVIYKEQIKCCVGHVTTFCS